VCPLGDVPAEIEETVGTLREAGHGRRGREAVVVSGITSGTSAWADRSAQLPAAGTGAIEMRLAAGSPAAHSRRLGRR
jgi:hypothetical protein